MNKKVRGRFQTKRGRDGDRVKRRRLDKSEVGSVRPVQLPRPPMLAMGLLGILYRDHNANLVVAPPETPLHIKYNYVVKSW